MSEGTTFFELAQSTISTFGLGFVAGSLFAILVLLILDWVEVRQDRV